MTLINPACPGQSVGASEIIRHFQAFLEEAKLSRISIKNYLSDVRLFLASIGFTTIRDIDALALQTYLAEIQETKPEASYRRYSASLRRFITFLSIEYRLELPFPKSNSLESGPKSSHNLINQFRLYLTHEKKSAATVKNYLSDLNHFLTWTANLSAETTKLAAGQPLNQLTAILTQKRLTDYFNHLKLSHTSTSVTDRRTSTLRKFVQFSLDCRLISHNPFETATTLPQIAAITLAPLSKNPVTRDQTTNPLKKLYYNYHALSFTPYLHLAILILATTALGIFGYAQIFSEAKSGQAYPPALVRPARQLSFQGRLTDQDGRPITSATAVTFKLYNQAESGTEVYAVPTCTVTPDEDGIFSTQIGNGQCGSEIGAEVFSENASLFLEVAIGGQTLTPRQPIATAGYALNSETLQGYPASASATENTVPVVNTDGDIIIGAASPAIISQSGTFAIKGQAVTLATETGTDGDVTVAPDGRGSVNLLGSLDKGIFVNVTDANLTTGTLIEGYVANNSRTGTLLHLASGTKQVNRLTISTTGQTDIIADTYAKAAFSIKQTGTGPIFKALAGQTQVAQLNTGGDLGLLGGLALGSPINTDPLAGQLLVNSNSQGQAGVIFNQNDSGPILTASSSGIRRFVIANNGNVGINTIDPTQGSLVVVGRTWTDQFTVAKNPVSGYVLTSDEGGNATWQASTGSGGTGGGWTLAAPIVYPNLTSYQVLVGATATASALGKLTVYGDSTSAPIAYLSGTTAAAALIIDNLGTGNLINASSSGTNKFTVANDGDITSAAIAVAGGTVWTDSTGNLNSVAGTAGQCLTSGGTGTPVWTACAGADSWQRNDGVLSPSNITDDLAIGGTATSSAKFQVFGDTGNATTSGNLTFNTTGTIQTTKNQTLTIGGATTGNIVLAPGGTTALTAISDDVTIADTLTVTTRQALGANATIDSLKTLNADATYTDPSGTSTGLNSAHKINVTAANANANYAVLGYAQTAGAGSPFTLSSSNALTGVGGLASNLTSDTVDNALGLYASISNTGGGTITNAYGLKIASAVNSSGTLTTNYGIAIDAQTAGSTDIGLYIADADTYSLQLASTDADAASGIAFATDTNLYRSAANILTTDDTFSAVTALQTGGTIEALRNFGVPQRFFISSANDANVPVLYVDSAGQITMNSQDAQAIRLNYDKGTGGILIGNGASGEVARFQSNGRVGINAASPLATLDVRSVLGTIPVASISGATSLASLVVDQTGIGDIFTASASGLNRFVITNAGNVGINTTLPSEALDVVGNATISGNLTFYGGTRTIASRLSTTLTIGDSQTGNIIISPQGGAVAASVTPSTDNQVDLGTSSFRWRNVYAGSFVGGLNPGLTPGSVVFAGSSGELAQDNANFFFNDTTNRLGLGTISPLATLDARATLGTVPTASISGATSFATLVVDNSGVGDIFTASSSGLNRFVITQAGNVGVGTTTPAYLLDVQGGTGVQVATFSGRVAGDYAVNANDFVTLSQVGSGAGGPWTRVDPNVYLTTITDQVGIGTNSPVGKFQVVNEIGTTSAASISATSSFATLVVDNSGVGDIFTASSSGLNRFVIKQNGNVGIGTTTPTDPLHVSRPGADVRNRLRLEVTGSATNQDALITFSDVGEAVDWSIGADDSSDVFRISNSAELDTTTRMLINASGNVGINTTTPTARLDVVGDASISASLVFRAASPTVDTLNGANLAFAFSPGGDALLATKFTIGATGLLTLVNSATIDNTINGTLALTEPTIKLVGSTSIDIDSPTIDLTTQAVNLDLKDTTVGALTFETSLLTLDTTNSRVGIGTATPAEKLDIVGNATISGNLTFYGGARTIASRLSTTLTIGDTQTGNIIISPQGGAVAASVTPSTDNQVDLGSAALRWRNIYGTLNPSFTEGSVVFIDSTGKLAQDNTNFFWNDSTNRLGLGTTSPLASLDARATLGTAPAASISGATSFATLVVDNSGVGDIFTASASGLNRFVITQAGNVGVATTTPSERLDVVGNATVSGNLTFYGGARTIASREKTALTIGDGDTGHITLSPHGGITGAYVAPNTDAQVDLGQSALRWRNVYAENVIATGLSGTIQGFWQRTTGSLTPAFISDDVLTGSISTASAYVKLTGTAGNPSFINTGSFGVGTTTTLATTDLRSMLGTIAVASISGVTSFATLVVDQSGVGDIFTASASGLNRFVITNAGNVGIGTTLPTTNLEVYESAGSVVEQVRLNNPSDAGAAGSSIGFRQGSLTSDAAEIRSGFNTAFYLAFEAGASEIMRLESNRVGIGTGTTLPLATTDLRSMLGTIPTASISGATSKATLVVDNSLNYDIIAASSSGARRLRLETTGDLTLYGSSGVATPPTGRVMPGFDAVQDIGATASQWKSIYLSNAIQNGATVSINLATQHFGDNGAGLWTFDNDASVSGNLNVVGTTWLGCNVAYPPGCGNPLTSQLIVGVSGTGKIDVGTVDPPYTINGEKYATYLPSMIGQNEEVTGNLTTSELVANVGYRTTIDFSNLPKASNLWLFSKITDLKTHIRDLAVVLTPASAARAWYELEPDRMLLYIYSSQPTTVSYRFTAPRFDSDKWTNTRPAEGIAGFVVTDPDLPLNNLAQNGPVVLDPTFTETNINQYELKLGNNAIAEIGSYASLLVANLRAGLVDTQKLISPVAEIDTLRVRTKLLSPLAQIDEIIASTISAEVVIADSATISGTLYAADLQSPVIDSLNSKYDLLSTDYATASSILAAIKAKYSDYASLTAPESGPVATISGDYALYNQPVIITDTLLVNTTLVSNSLNSADGSLYLQPTASAPINLLAGLVTLSPDGQVTINGDLTVTGTLLAHNSEFINLKSDVATISGNLVLGKEATPSVSNNNLASFFNENGDLVSAINASGAASFKELATSGLIIANAATESATATSSGAFNTNATIGTGTISAGETELIIANSAVRTGTYVYLTPISDTTNQVLYIKSKHEGTGFTVAINQPLVQDVTFNYWLIQTQP